MQGLPTSSDPPVKWFKYGARLQQAEADPAGCVNVEQLAATLGLNPKTVQLNGLLRACKTSGYTYFPVAGGATSDSAILVVGIPATGALAPIDCEHAVMDALEVLYTTFWQNVGYGLPEYVGKRLNFEVITGRNVIDTSITIEDNKRDFMLHLFKVLLVGGEDKAFRSDMPKARSKLETKHKGANAAVYGGLGYIVLIATAGDMCAVNAKRLAKDTQMVPIIEEFEMRSQGGRRKVVQLFVNITRWIRTVDALKLLPPPPPAPLAVPFCRPLTIPRHSG
ncbi:hypothetical protein WJX72_004697 [[Myrmecia] bisecta]|uniref:Uncharacterized protein n=1 Tax=[Myrmecia] bisecta TaxID=41462 RepID=A0AAW1PWL4_9CHLO